MRFLAIDWGDSDCRYLLASVQKGTVTIHKVGDTTIESKESDSDESLKSSDLADLTATLRRVFKEERIGSNHTLLCLNRNKVELLYLTLPPCRDAEIPVLLKNQVLRELAGFNEHDPLDYLVLSDAAEERRRILAATIPLSYRQSLARNFRSINCTPQGICLKSLTAAQLLFHSDSAPEEFEPGLILNIVGNDVDLILAEGKQILSIRSFRLPEQLRFVEMMNRIAEEVRRTVVVGDDSVTGRPIKKVFLYGNNDDWVPLVEILTSHELDVFIVNPFTVTGIRVSEKMIPEQPGRFASLLGILFSQQQSETKSCIDLLHPKEAPKPANYLLSIFLTIFLLAIIGYGLYYWNNEVIRGLEAELVKVKEEHQKVAAQLQQVQPGFNVLRAARNWEMQNVMWLDELRELSTVLPNEQDLVVLQMSFSMMENNPRYAGMIQMSGMVRDPSVLLKLQTDLRTRGVYMMQYQAPSANPAGGGYPWLFRTTIFRLRR
jgi:hypothetical protein